MKIKIKEQKKGRSETGITLVALVVTIVVLLILAGITIGYVFGENSIFNKDEYCFAYNKDVFKKINIKPDSISSLEEIFKNPVILPTKNSKMRIYLEELLKTVDIISINVNRDVCLIGGDNLKIYGNGKAIINTAIGKCYELNSLKEWLQNKNNYYICDDATVNDDIKEILNYDNVIYTNAHSGVTRQCLERATAQIINNIKNACI